MQCFQFCMIMIQKKDMWRIIYQNISLVVQNTSGKDLTQSYDKSPFIDRKSKKQRENTKTPQKTSITQRLRTDLGRSVGVTIAIQLVWLNRFTGSQPSHLPQKPCNQKDTHLKMCK